MTDENTAAVPQPETPEPCGATNEAIDRLAECVKDVCWRAIQYGETEDGDVFAYLVTKGAMHRLIGAAQGAGISAAFRADSRETLPDAGPAQPSAAAHDEPTIEDVLAEHQDFRFMRNTIGGYRRDWWECTCRWSLPLPTDAEVSKAHRAHVAQVLRQAIKDGAR